MHGVQLLKYLDECGEARSSISDKSQGPHMRSKKKGKRGGELGCYPANPNKRFGHENEKVWKGLISEPCLGSISSFLLPI